MSIEQVLNCHNTLQLKTYCDAIGTGTDVDDLFVFYSDSDWRFEFCLASDGLFIVKASGASTEVGTNIVKCNASAAWQEWQFRVSREYGDDAAFVDVYLKEEGGSWTSQGTFDCDYEIAGVDRNVFCLQYGWATNDRISHIDYIRIGTGFGEVVGWPVLNKNYLELNLKFNKEIEIKTLGEIFILNGNGSTNSKDITNTGEYPFYRASCNNPCGTHNTYDFDGNEYLLIIKSGGCANKPISSSYGIGKVFIVNGKCAANIAVFQLILKNLLRLDSNPSPRRKSALISAH
jgi:hypothetical protein